MTFYQFAIKRLFDIVIAGVGIIILLPLMSAIALLVKFTSRGPVLYVQERIGRFGKPFKCIKFRTMSVGADIHGSVTTANDRRITPVGGLLRRCKLDELPQLGNVLIGKMSFVGPRPDVPGYADCLFGDDRSILVLRPGITGPASIFFRYEEELLAQTGDPVAFNDHHIWPAKIQINRQYLEHWGFFKDIAFILITVIPATNRFFRLQPDSPRTLAQFEAIHNDPHLYSFSS